ncbi:MAG: thiamine phosphate synthase [Candidatus Omnitrophota bacterium]
MIRGYYFITDSRLTKRDILSDVKSALEAKVEVIQYRNKNANTKSLYEEASLLRKVCKDVCFIVNDRIDVALAVGACGVHLGVSDMSYEAARDIMGKGKIIGVTVRTKKEAVILSGKGADYLSLGPIFETTTKKDLPRPRGAALISEIRKECKTPLVAIGGITLSNAKEIIEAGADAICAISAVVTKDNVKEEIVKFQSLFI